MIKVVPIKGKGIGLVAVEAIPAGTRIVGGPVRLFPLGTASGTLFYDLVWRSGDNECLTLSAHTLCNDDPVSANCECELKDGWDTLKSKRDIKAGEELTLDYLREFGR